MQLESKTTSKQQLLQRRETNKVGEVGAEFKFKCIVNLRLQLKAAHMNWWGVSKGIMALTIFQSFSLILLDNKKMHCVHEKCNMITGRMADYLNVAEENEDVSLINNASHIHNELRDSCMKPCCTLTRHADMQRVLSDYGMRERMKHWRWTDTHTCTWALRLVRQILPDNVTAAEQHNV